jgi:hypothetical protein
MPGSTAPPGPHDALEELLGLSGDLRDGVLLDAGSDRLAGRRALAGPAQELLAASEAPELEVSTGHGTVFASRDADHALVVVADRSALSALVLYDMRVTLQRLAGGA